MVRFSDIIKIKDKKELEEESLQEKEKEASSNKVDSPFKTTEEELISTGPPPREGSKQEVVAYYNKFIKRAYDISERVKNNRGISPSPILADLHYIIDKGLIDEFYEYAMTAKDEYDEMLIHTVSVAITSLKIGQGMGYDLKNLLRLGLAAFLENVGMYKIPERILKNKGPLGNEDVALIKKHPDVSFEILSEIGERYGWLAEIARQVHERFDGSGYPLGLKGNEIHELASVIGLVDSYIAMIKNRPYREKFIQTDAIKSIVETNRGLFPPKIIKNYLNQISLFPVNSYVKLNNGSIGRVISTDKKQPLRPIIELLYDGSGNKMMDKQLIRLSENPLLYIDSSINADTLD